MRLLGSTQALPALRWSLRPRFQRDWIWGTCTLLAALMLTAAAFLPLWQMTLLAPQYPGGLELEAYGTRMEGDLREINALNHYVGVQPIDPDSVVELQLFPFALGALVLALLVGALFVRRPLYRVVLAAAVWSVPIGLLADLQWWLYRYGQDLDPTAALRLDPFIPKVIGTTEVMNFHTQTMVSVGFWLMIAAALVITVGPWVIRFVRDSWQNTGEAPRASALILVLLAGSALALVPTPRAEAAQPAFSIAAAIAAAEPGATILVPAGVYDEQLVIGRSVILEGGGEAVIDGGGRGDVIHVTAENVTLRGFVIRNSARQVHSEPAGIRVTADGVTLEDNRVEDVLYGIALINSNGHTVRGNSISSMLDLAPERRGHALYLWYTDGNVLEGNTIQQAKDGIFLGFTSNTSVTDNLVTQVRYGLHTMYSEDLVLRGNVFRDNVAGASLMYTRGMLIIDNEFSGNRSAASGYGLLFKDMDDVELTGNRIHHNRLGITMDGAPRTPGAFVTFSGNLIAYNQTAIELFTTVSATFVENTFVGNLGQVESRGGRLEHRNTWAVNGRGNYWDDYQGYDRTGDGVGDIPYRYEGAFDDLARRNEAVRAYSYTPARTALDLAARWFPVYQPETRLVDPHPLMSPTVTLRTATDDVGAADRVAPAAVSLGLVIVPLAIFIGASRIFGKGWA